MSETVFERDRFMNHKYMDEPLEILGTSGETDWADFLEPWGPHKVTIVHLVAFNGNLKMLERAFEFDVDLNAVDGFRRSALHHAAFQGHVDIVKWLLHEPSTRDQLRLTNSDGDTALHEAVGGLRCDSARSLPGSNSGNVAVVELLLQYGAQVNATNHLGFSPLLVAGIVLSVDCGPKVSVWYDKVVKILLSAGASANLKPDFWVETPLHYAVLLGSCEAAAQLLKNGASLVDESFWMFSPLHIAAGGENPAMVNMLLEEMDSSLIDLQNPLGFTPLHFAAQTGHVENFCALVNRGASLLTKNADGNTVLHVLFEDRANSVAYLTDVLNSQVRLEDDVMLNLDFKVLVPPDRPQMAVVSALICAVPSIEEMAILRHPLLETFLRLKWSKFRYIFFILITLHVSFLLLLFWYAVELRRKHVNSLVPRRLLLVCALILLSHNLIQLLTTPRHYVRHFEHWFSMICVIMSIAIAVAGEFLPEVMDVLLSGDSNTERIFVQPYPWLFDLVSVVILLAGIQMMLVIGRFPASGYYTLMFFAVLRNVLKLLLVFACIIISFAFSFLVLFQDENQFQNPWVAVVKTVVMMTGEYDYGDLLTTSNQSNVANNTLNSQDTLLPYTRRIVFLIFVMLAHIVLMNLITALAVTDVQDLVKEGKLRGLMKQVEFMADFEHMTAHWIFSSKRTPNCFKKILNTDIFVRTFLARSWFRPHYVRFVYRPRFISQKLKKVLFALGEKNRDSAQRSQVKSSHQAPEPDLTKTIFGLQKQVRELQRKNMQLQRMQYGNSRDVVSETVETSTI